MISVSPGIPAVLPCCADPAGRSTYSGVSKSNEVPYFPAATAHGINNSGQVALDQGVYSNGTITPAPPLPGQSTAAVALAINASGQVAGSAASPTEDALLGEVAIAYSSGTLTNLAALFPGTNGLRDSAATGINSSGEIIGWHFDVDELPGAPTPGFTFNNGTLTTIRTLQAARQRTRFFTTVS